MEIVLWRHADAEEGAEDAARPLTPKGVKQAERVAAWLDARLPKNARIMASPAVRAQQTARALARKFTTSQSIGTGARASEVLKAAGWPDAGGTVVIVGHQPTLGAAAALAVTGAASPWRMQKGALWWIAREDDDGDAIVRAVMTPELLKED